MGVSIASDVKGPPPNRMPDSVQYDPLEHLWCIGPPDAILR
jgi:hypothetical protein